MIHNYYLLIVVLGCILFCVKNPGISGPSTEQGNPQISAVIFDSTLKPVQNVSVYVLRIPDELDTAADSSKILSSPAIRIISIKSDNNGRCAFTNLISGTYRLEAVDSARNLMVISGSIVIQSSVDKPVTDTLILQTPGLAEGVVIRGESAIVNNNLQNAFIQIRIKELDRFYITDPSGKYLFDNLPIGEYTFYYYASNGFYIAKRKGIIVQSGIRTVVDTVELVPYSGLLPPSEFSQFYDSLKNVVLLSWRPVNYNRLSHYVIERFCDINDSLHRQWKTRSTALSDTLRNIPDSTYLSYVIHAVDSAYNSSANAGPVKVFFRDNN
jgi:hypothetical protein